MRIDQQQTVTKFYSRGHAETVAAANGESDDWKYEVVQVPSKNPGVTYYIINVFDENGDYIGNL